MIQDTRNRIWFIVALALLVGLAVWTDLPNNPGITVGSIHRDLKIKLGLDLQGGSHLIYRATVDDLNIEDPSDALAGVRDVIERRVNAFGVAEPVIQTNKSGGEYRVIVELAGVHDPMEAIRQIGETPQLDFRKEISADALGDLNIDSPEQVVGSLFERTDLTGKHLQRASVTFDQITGTPQVNLDFNSAGADLFAALTKENIGRRVAIYLDGVPISAPVVQSEITTGQAVITGGFNLEEAKQLARRLNAGALPVPIELIGQATVGPTLGKISIEQSLRAGLVGLAAVVLWMISYYRLPGLVSAISLIIYAVLFIAVIKIIPVTLTLAGIAGLILSIGMAVDANVLIFERFRENLRAGKTVGYAHKEGFQEAWDSIRASNVSGLITGFILYAFGTSIVRGFALTFSIGILLSVFTAVNVSRGILTWLLAYENLHRPWLLGAPIRKQP